MNRTKSEELFFNAHSAAAAFEELELSWPSIDKVRRSPKHPIDRTSPEEKDATLWRVGDDGHGYLGIRPILMTVGILCRFGLENTPSDVMTSQRFLMRSVDLPKPAETGIEGLTENDLPKYPEQAIHKLFLRSKKPSNHRADLEGYYFLAFCDKQLKDVFTRANRSCRPDPVRYEDILEVWAKIQAERPASVAAVFDLLRPLLPKEAGFCAPDIDQPPQQNFAHGTHCVPRRYMEYVSETGTLASRENPQIHSDKARDICKHLATDRMAILHGNVHSGKSSVVVEILRRLASKSDGNTLCLEAVSVEPLPVCVININRYSSVDAALKVLTFLETQTGRITESQRNAHYKALKSKYADNDRIVALEQVHRDIRTQSGQRAAFFIFTNWEEKGQTAPRSMMRDQNRTELMHVLHESNMNTRILLTTLGSDGKLPKLSSSTMPKAEIFKLKDPKVNQIDRYWPDVKINDPHQIEVVSELKWRLNKAEIPGECLMIIATLLQLAALNKTPAAVADAQSRTREAVLDFADVYTQDLARAKRVKRARHVLTAALLKELDELGLLRIILAITCSDDGLRPKSLRRALEWWRLDAGTDFKRADPIGDLTTMMRDLAAGFFIRKVPSGDQNRAQLDPEETDHEDRQFQISQTVREMIFDLIQNPDVAPDPDATDLRPLLLQTHRYVARIARYRARNWRRTAAKGHLTKNWRDFWPAIQSYETLLCSIDQDGLLGGHRTELIAAEYPLGQRELEVFQVAPGTADGLALRFAVLCLLRNEIDPDNRLCLQYDQDLLRTKLYLAPFMQLGRKHFLQAMELNQSRDLPATLPLHMWNWFSPEEIIDLLSAASVSAYHSQSIETLIWTSQMFEQVLVQVQKIHPKEHVERLRNRGIRIKCSEIDMAILRGQPIGRNTRRFLDYKPILDTVRNLINKDYKDLNLPFLVRRTQELDADSIENGVNAIILSLHSIAERPDTYLPVKFDLLLPWMRLKAREAELLYLLGHTGLSVQLYRALHRIEAAIEASYDMQGPQVMIGRPVRPQLRALMSWLVTNRKKGQKARALSDTTEHHIRTLLSGNEARLSKFGGAEQAAFLADGATFETKRSKGVIKKALADVRRARDLVDKDQASLTMLLSVLSAQLNIELVAIEVSSADPVGPDVDRFLSDADLLFRLSDGLGLVPMIIQSYELRARLFLKQLKADVPRTRAAARSGLKSCIEAAKELFVHPTEPDRLELRNPVCQSILQLDADSRVTAGRAAA